MIKPLGWDFGLGSFSRHFYSVGRHYILRGVNRPANGAAARRSPEGAEIGSTANGRREKTNKYRL